MLQMHQYCSYCGTPYEVLEWPRLCGHCHQFTFRNPTPVCVILLPIDEDGLLLVQRNIEPAKGEWALPGGYMEIGETFQQTCVRELWEETGIVVDASDVVLFDVQKGTDDILIIFGIAKPQPQSCLSVFQPNEESLDYRVIKNAEVVAFPKHTLMIQKFFLKTN